MNYREAIDYLFNIAPLFQHIGAGAYKEGLTNTHLLDEHFGHPHRAYKTIHVAGTNGKGSVSHTLAAILQSAGYRVGLYTSPHLVDFRERIRVNGKMIPEERVVRFVEEERTFFEPLCPSFFELATALAFQYFKEEEVDIAVIEVGLGGRLDCTNIITPLLSIITNISFDHTQFLGNTLEKIAREKAGIIKRGIPVVIGETGGDNSVHQVFLDKAQAFDAPITFADEEEEVVRWHDGIFETRHFGTFQAELRGFCQEKNTATILAAIEILRASGELPPLSTLEPIHNGFAHVCELTGLMGRWQTIQERPTVVCDTGHNPGGLQYIVRQLKAQKSGGTLRIVLGMVSDKDVCGSLSLFPHDAHYYFTQASVKRAMPAEEIAALGHSLGLNPHADEAPDFYPTVAEACRKALSEASAQDFIFVGGSSFIVADLLCFLNKQSDRADFTTTQNGL